MLMSEISLWEMKVYNMWRCGMIVIVACVTSYLWSKESLVLRLAMMRAMIGNQVLFNPFSFNVPLLYPLKTSENLRISDIFRGYGSGTLVEIGLAFTIYLFHNNDILFPYKVYSFISKRVLQENKPRQIFGRTNISYPLIRTHTCAYQEVRNVFVFRNIWRVLFSCSTVLRFAFLPYYRWYVRFER